MDVSLEYGHWGITVSQRHSAVDYAPFATTFFAYPVGARGPVDSSSTEKAAMAYSRLLGGNPKGPFFSRAA